jgi:hypothetical protein
MHQILGIGRIQSTRHCTRMYIYTNTAIFLFVSINLHTLKTHLENPKTQTCLLIILLFAWIGRRPGMRKQVHQIEI